MTFLAILAIIVVLIVAAVAGGAALIAVRQKRSFASANEVVAGVATNAPPGWAGAHSPEARLHRRLTEAVAALRANATLSDGAFVESRVSVEQAALAIDERLIAAAALPAGHRTAAIAAVEPVVVALENAVAALAAPTTGPAATQQALDDSVRAAQIRLHALAEARTELDRFDSLAARQQVDELGLDTPKTQPPTPGGTTG